jgi:hypothetical protein
MLSVLCNSWPTPGGASCKALRESGGGDLWVSEFILTYDNQPFYTVRKMEFHGAKVAHETQYFADSEGTFAGLSGRAM